MPLTSCVSHLPGLQIDWHQSPCLFRRDKQDQCGPRARSADMPCTNCGPDPETLHAPSIQHFGSANISTVFGAQFKRGGAMFEQNQAILKHANSAFCLASREAKRHMPRYRSIPLQLKQFGNNAPVLAPSLAETHPNTDVSKPPCNLPTTTSVEMFHNPSVSDASTISISVPCTIYLRLCLI